MSQLRARQKRIWQVTEQIINGWDPYGLLNAGAPPDEYVAEINAIVTKIDQVQSEEDATRLVARVFSYYFEPEKFTPAFCREVGENLFAALKREDLLT